MLTNLKKQAHGMNILKEKDEKIIVLESLQYINSPFFPTMLA